MQMQMQTTWYSQVSHSVTTSGVCSKSNIDMLMFSYGSTLKPLTHFSAFLLCHAAGSKSKKKKKKSSKADVDWAALEADGSDAPPVSAQTPAAEQPAAVPPAFGPATVPPATPAGSWLAPSFHSACTLQHVACSVRWP